MTELLDRLREAGADEQVGALAARAAAHADLSNPAAVARLLDGLRTVGTEDQVAALVKRLPGAGLFGLFYTQQSLENKFRYGREADGTAAGSWDWADLE